MVEGNLSTEQSLHLLSPPHSSPVQSVLSPFAHCGVFLFPSQQLSQPCSPRQYGTHYGWVHLSRVFCALPICIIADLLRETVPKSLFPFFFITNWVSESPRATSTPPNMSDLQMMSWCIIPFVLFSCISAWVAVILPGLSKENKLQLFVPRIFFYYYCHRSKVHCTALYARINKLKA